MLNIISCNEKEFLGGSVQKCINVLKVKHLCTCKPFSELFSEEILMLSANALYGLIHKDSLTKITHYTITDSVHDNIMTFSEHS